MNLEPIRALKELADESIQHWATVSNDETLRIELYRALPALSQLLEAVARVEALQFNWAKADGVDDPDGGTFLQCADELKRAFHPEDK